ncbi:MAG: beta-ketoacyl synthase [Fluviicola sp.]|nr:MAG: beta-ketoacyl synthase [Fluviicola sp.]
MDQDFSNISVYATSGNCLSPAGSNVSENLVAIDKGNLAIEKHSNSDLSESPFYGAIISETVIEKEFSKLNYEGPFSKLEKMILIVLNGIVTKYSHVFSKRCGIIFSTTKGNIDALDNAEIENYYLHNTASKISKAMDIKTQPIVLSNACVSGIMAVSVAKRLIQTDKYDHIVVVGADLFSKFVFSGFQSFQAVSPKPCKPYSKNRDGITLGEAAAAMFVTKDKSLLTSNSYKITGESSINDANHISGPSRTGEGLFQSVQKAIKEAGVKPKDIDMISSHGTATNYNDEMEAQAFSRADLAQTPLFSLKGFFGHTLGAAGLLETVISLASADENKIPPSFGFDEMGVTLPLNISAQTQSKSIHTVLKTASGFGGSNTAVIFQKFNTNE